MHEMSLINNLMNKVYNIAKENNAKKITKVRVQIGALAHISAEHFKEHFDEAAINGPAERAELEVETKSDIHDPRAQDIILLSVDVEES